MGALADLERFFERLFERPASRLFRTQLQPIHLQRRIERAMETERVTGADRTYVPHMFRLRLQPDDLAAFEGMAETLALELADAALRFARSHRFALVERPRVEIVADPSVRTGEIRVDAGFGGWADHGEPRAPAATLAAEGSTARGFGHEAEIGPEQRGDLQAARAGDSGANRARSGTDRGPSDTRVFAVPEVAVPTTALTVRSPNGMQRRISVERAVLTIGRAPDNDIRLADPRVSRHHARLQARRGGLILTDLESRNGSRVNGLRIDEVALGDGDLIELGDSTIIVGDVEPS